MRHNPKQPDTRVTTQAMQHAHYATCNFLTQIWFYRNGRVWDPLDFLQVVIGVLIGHVGWADVQFEVRPKVLKLVVVWELCGVERTSQRPIRIHY